MQGFQGFPSKKLLGLVLAVLLFMSVSVTGLALSTNFLQQGKSTMMAYKGYFIHLNLPVVKLIFKRN
jgi:hypothetical protein